MQSFITATHQLHLATFPDSVLCQLCFRRSCDAAIAQHWLKANFGIVVRFRLAEGWYCASFLNPPLELIEQLQQPTRF